MADPYAITNPRRALKRREMEAGAGTASDGDGGTAAAPGKKPEAAPAPAPDSSVRFTTGPRRLSAEEQARQVEQFRKLQRRQRAATVI